MPLNTPELFKKAEAPCCPLNMSERFNGTVAKAPSMPLKYTSNSRYSEVPCLHT